MTGKQRQAELAYQFGLWLAPVLDVLQKPADHDSASRRRIRAQFAVDHDRVAESHRQFCFKEMGIENSAEWHDIQDPVGRINNLVRKLLDTDSPSFKEAIEADVSRFHAALAAVPVDDGRTNFDAGTPFSTYCALKPMFDLAAREVIYIDRYTDESLFCRYLKDVPGSAVVTVVRSMKALPPEFLDASRLFAAERGPAKYRLLQEGSFHDRLLRIDGQTRLLGGSIKDAGAKSPYTVSTLPADQAAQVDKVIAAATEVFGPTQTVHP